MTSKMNRVPTSLESDFSFVRTARIAGLLYLAIIVCGIFGEFFVRGQLVDPTDAALTANRILGSGLLYKSGFVADSIMIACDVAVAVLLYHLMRPVNAALSLTSAAFRLIQAAILAVNLLSHYAPLLLLGDSAFSVVFSGPQRNAIILLLLDFHGYAYDLGLLFFAVSILVLGFLAAKSPHFPTPVGYGLQLAGAVYLVGSYCRFLLPDYSDFLQPAYVIPLVAELSFCLSLMTTGVKSRDQKTLGDVRK